MNTSILEFVLDLLTGFKKEEKIKSLINIPKKEIVIWASILIVLSITIYFLISFKFAQILLKILLGYLAIQSIIYFGSILIGGLGFLYFSLKLIWNYKLRVSLIKIGPFSFPKYHNGFKSSTHNDIEHQRKQDLEFYFSLYKSGGLTEEEYEKEKNRILNQ